MFSARAKAVSRRKFFLQSLLWGSFAFLVAGLVATAQDTAQPAPTTPPAAEVIQEIVETSESLPIPEPAPPPAPEPSPPQEVPEKTPDAPAFATPQDVEVAPAAQPPVRGADVAFPTPSGASTNEPLVMFGRPVAKADYGSGGNLRASQLRSMPPQKFTFDRSTLRDVLRLLAEEAGIPYIGIPEHSPKAQRLVTFKMTASPFAALEGLARQNDIQLTFEDGVWFMRVRDSNVERARAAERDNELLGVIYQLKYDPVDVVDFKDDAGNEDTERLGSSSTSTPQLPLQNSQRVFEAKAPRIVNEIRVMLGMPPLGGAGAEDKGGGEANASQAMSGTEVQSQRLPTFDGAPNSTEQASAEQAEQEQGLFPIYVPPQKPQVIYNSDTNILWVVATRKQHKWVADYLSRVDKPQDLIAIEVKFFETNKNPQTEFGINWEGVLGGDGLQVTGSGQIGNNPNDPLAGVTGTINGANGAVSFNAPYSAVLSVQQATLAIQAFTRDREGSLVQYPRVLTINNREVAITSAENTPVNAGVQTVQSGGSSSQPVGTLEYLPVGTQINILPKAVGRDQIALAVAITVSSIIDTIPINLGTGINEYPVTAERVYNASLQVNSGYTLAVGGLEKSTDLRNTGGVPLLKDIPGVGYLFKNKTRNRNRSNLIIFITPYVIDDPSRTPGISETPESTIPVRPGVPPPAPTFSPDGQLIGGAGALPGAFSWLEYQLKYFRQINKEARDDAKTVNQLRGVIQRARALSNNLQAQVLEGAGYAPATLLDSSARADALLLELNKVLSASQLDQFQLNEGFP